MKLAFIDCLPVGGGLSRFSLLLCKGLIENYSSLTIDYFIHHSNLKHIPEIKSIDKRLNVKLLNSTCPKTLLSRTIKKVIKISGTEDDNDKVLNEIEKEVNSNYDLAYFPSAHMMKRPNLNIPVVGTLHDFNWKYFFGRQIFSKAFVEMMDIEILNWMNNGLNICSSQDVVDEAKKLYPEAKNFPVVIHIAPVVVHANISEEKADSILKQLNIDFPYIIFPGNFFPHKNHLNLFTAFSMLKERKGFNDYKLILTGMNSDQVTRGIAGRRGVRLLTKNSSHDDFDVMGMGYQSNEVIDALISKANLLVSPSLYEAICTPAMDAWNFGTPTAISDIPPFREHEKAWGIRSAFFDPMDPKNMADVIEAYLNNYDSAIEEGKVSQANMAKYSWKEVTDGYMKIFEKAMISI
ncbi:MAG: glycosyltransferase [Ginsengibacter sp.]